MTSLPQNLSQPARRALAAEGITTLEQVAEYGSKALLKLHGFGPKSIRQIKEAMSGASIIFKKD